MKMNLVKGLLVAGAATLFAQGAFAQATPAKFEGTVTWKLKSAQFGDDDYHDMLMNMKGNKTEIDIDAGLNGMVHMYIDRDSKKMIQVMDAMKMGMEHDLPNDDAAASANADTKDDGLKATGQKSTVNGHAAELYTLVNGDETVSMWMSNDFKPEFAAALKAALANSSRGSEAQKHAMRALAEKGYFPVKVESKDGGTMELVNVEAKSIPDAKFEVAKDITVRQMPAGMGGMRGGAPHGGGGMMH